VRVILDAVSRTEERIVQELTARVQPAHDSHEMSRSTEVLKGRVDALSAEFNTLAEHLDSAQRSALQQIADDMRDLRTDLRVYTTVMAVAVIAVLLLLAVVILFKIG
jgi:hypothetical protein